MSTPFSTELRQALRDEYARGWDEAEEHVWESVVCSVCGWNHDRDESAACEGCEPITFREWVNAARRTREALAVLYRSYAEMWEGEWGSGGDLEEFEAELDRRGPTFHPVAHAARVALQGYVGER